MKKEYNAEFTNDLLVLANFKLAAENNAMLKVLIENVIEIRTQLTNVENWVEKDDIESEKLKILYAPILDELRLNVRELINDAILSQEQISMKESYEWAFLQDPDSGDVSSILT